MGKKYRSIGFFLLENLIMLQKCARLEIQHTAVLRNSWDPDLNY